MKRPVYLFITLLRILHIILLMISFVGLFNAWDLEKMFVLLVIIVGLNLSTDAIERHADAQDDRSWHD